jgi:hypothetical protein
VHQAVRDTHQSPIKFRGEDVQPRAGLELAPGAVVGLPRFVALVEVDVGAEQRLPLRPVPWPRGSRC